jgi:hypothetical protein
LEVQASQRFLLEQAEQFVRRFVKERGEFSMFALALGADESIIPVQTSDEFDNTQSSLGGVLGALAPLAMDGTIVGCVICTPMQADGIRFAIYDVDHKLEGRFIAMQQYKKRLFGGWSFGGKELSPDASRLFAP